MTTNPPQHMEWNDPPALKRKASKWEPVALALRANPGKWAKIVTEGNTGVSVSIRQGELRCFKPAGSFEVRVANMSGVWVGDVYARYVGENREHA